MLSIRFTARLLGRSPSTVFKARQREQGYQPAEDGTIRIRRLVGLSGKYHPSRHFDTTPRQPHS